MSIEIWNGIRLDSNYLEPCPFCSAQVETVTDKDFHMIVGSHDICCPLFGVNIAYPKTDNSHDALVADWNKRKLQ